MTYRSQSRGIVYSAPPSGDEQHRTEEKQNRTEENRETDESADETPESTDRTPELEETTATTDANWTGAVPADD